jgi:hypothetical protein
MEKTMNRILTPVVVIVTLAAASSAWAAPTKSTGFNATKFFANLARDSN